VLVNIAELTVRELELQIAQQQQQQQQPQEQWHSIYDSLLAAPLAAGQAAVGEQGSAIADHLDRQQQQQQHVEGAQLHKNTAAPERFLPAWMHSKHEAADAAHTAAAVAAAAADAAGAAAKQHGGSGCADASQTQQQQQQQAGLVYPLQYRTAATISR
jgi:hypothetical protein